MKAISLFSSAGVGEVFFAELGIAVVAANELIPDRAQLYRDLYPDSCMITGDITDEQIYAEIDLRAGTTVDLIIATPPCQGISIAGKNRHHSQVTLDPRNSLILQALRLIDTKKPNYVLIENVPGFLKMLIPYQGELLGIVAILQKKYAQDYEIDYRLLDAADYGVPQYRKRAFIKLYKKGCSWPWPKPASEKITVRQAIGDLPSLEAGRTSEIAFHYARPHTEHHVNIMAHTATGMSAHDNLEWYPKNKHGERVKGYNTTYRRIQWDEPAPTITMRNDAISSQKNVHPGRLQSDGTYSDARVLTPRELMILDSLPADWNVPPDTPELLIRKVLGESVPPLLLKKILETIMPA